MKAISFAACLFLAINSLHCIDIVVKDVTNLNFLNTTVTLDFKARNGTGSLANNATIDSGSAVELSRVEQGRSVFYTFGISPLAPSFVTGLNVTVEAQKSAPDGARRYIEEIEVSATFASNSEMKNWTDTPLTLRVQPPRFPHFQVKTDWQYRCPVQLRLGFCHLDNGTTPVSCDQQVSAILALDVTFINTVFNGGMNTTHDYSSKIEECPLAYETRQDIGIGCIAAFWSIALAAVLWGVIKYVIKRQRKSRME